MFAIKSQRLPTALVPESWTQLHCWNPPKAHLIAMWDFGVWRIAIVR